MCEISSSLEINHKSMDVSAEILFVNSELTSGHMQVVKKSQAGAGVAVKIEHAVYQSAKMFGRHFDEHDEIISHITRASIDILKVRLTLSRCKSALTLFAQRKHSEKTSPTTNGA